MVFIARRPQPSDNGIVSLLPPRPSPLAPGFHLDRYELICPIAEGGMASVWIARQTGKHGFEKLVAVKTILPKYAAEPRFQRMFLDEARIASRIEHANVTEILDVGEQHGVTFLVMEYVDGDALSKVLRAAEKTGAVVPPGIVLRAMAEVCGGLHCAHELRDARGEPLGVVHRDVSPQNVLVTTRGVAKLIDFGIAKARDRLSGDTNTDQLKGKVQYMAPEQAMGRPIDRRADVWAVGAVLYHLLAGRPPFQGDNDIQTLFLLSSGRPPPPMPARVPPEVAAVVSKALAHSPDTRYPTALALQQAIEDAAQRAGIATTATHVAAYLESVVGERADARKEAIALGLSAAADRERISEMMRAVTDRTRDGSASPVAPRPSGAQTVAERVGAWAADRAAAPPREQAAERALDRGEVPTSLDGRSPGSSGEHTLGRVALALEPRERSRSWRFALVGGAVGASVALLALVGIVGSQRETSKSTGAAERPPVASLPAPPPEPALAQPAPQAATAPPAPSESAPAATPSAADPAPQPAASPASALAAAAPTSPAPLSPPPSPARSVPATGPRPAVRPKARVNDGF
jgi:hypothetical protein